MNWAEHLWQLAYVLVGAVVGYVSALLVWNRQRKVQAQATRKLLASMYGSLERYLDVVIKAPTSEGSTQHLADRAELIVDRTFSPETRDALTLSEAKTIYDGILEVEGGATPLWWTVSN